MVRRGDPKDELAKWQVRKNIQ